MRKQSGPHILWDGREIAFLRECAFAKIPAANIANVLDRTTEAIRMKRHNLGLPPETRRVFRCQGNERGVSVATIRQVVADHFGIAVESMQEERRTRQFARPRQVAMFFARELGRKSYPKIGTLFGNRDHTTALHAFRTVGRLMEQDHNFKDTVETLQAQLMSDTPAKTVEIGNSPTSYDAFQRS